MEAFDPELERYLTPDELNRLATAKHHIDHYLEAKKQNEDKVAMQVGEIEKSTAPPGIRAMELELCKIELKSFSLYYKEPTYAYRVIEELRKAASDRKVAAEAEAERLRKQLAQAQQKEEEAQRKSIEYGKQLDIQINNFKGAISNKRRKIRFPKDKRDVRGYDFAYLLPLDNEADYREVAGEWIREMVIPANLQDFVSFDYRLFWHFLPCAEYRLEEVPYLDIGFHIWLGIEAKFWLKPSKVTINGYEFDMPQMECPVSFEHEGKILYSAIRRQPLLKPEQLGYYYLVLTPSELMDDGLGYTSWQTVPCVLIEGLLQSDPEPEGCTIIEAYEGWTNYQVDGFDQEVKMPHSFGRYLNEIGTWDSLRERGIITDEIMGTVQRAMARAKSKQVPQLGTSEGSQIVEALISLGTPKDQAKTAANDILQNYPDLSLEEKVKLAIQLLSKEASNSLTN